MEAETLASQTSRGAGLGLRVCVREEGKVSGRGSKLHRQQLPCRGLGTRRKLEMSSQQPVMGSPVSPLSFLCPLLSSRRQERAGGSLGGSRLGDVFSWGFMDVFIWFVVLSIVPTWEWLPGARL